MSSELLNEFIYDTREHLSIAGANLLDLEKEPSSKTALNTLLGTLHTIKGNSGFLALQNLYELLHHAETLLQTIRDNPSCTYPPKITDLLLQVLDTIEAVLDRLENGDNDKVDWLSSLKQALSEAETKLEMTLERLPSEDLSPPWETNEQPVQTSSTQTGEPVPTDFTIEEDLTGEINFIYLEDGLLSEESDILPIKTQAMFKAGLKALVFDLSKLASISGPEIKTLLITCRNNPEKIFFTINEQDQEDLYRIFKILQIDKICRTFPGKEEVVLFIEENL